MYPIAKKILSIVLVAIIILGAVPKRADAVIPGIAAAAAALGVSESAVVAGGSALLTAGGVTFLSDEGRRAAVAAAWQGASEATKELMRYSIYGAVDGLMTINIDEQCAADIREMMRVLELSEGEDIDWVYSGEGVWYEDFGNYSLSGFNDGEIEIVIPNFVGADVPGGVNDGSHVGIELCPDYNSQGVKMEVHGFYNKDYSLKYYVFDGKYGTTVASGTIDTMSGTGPYDFGEHSIKVRISEGNEVDVFIDGNFVHTMTMMSNYAALSIFGGNNSITANGFDVIENVSGVVTLQQGVHYNPSTLTPEQIASLAGTSVTTNINDYSQTSNPVINPPITWPEATDLTGVIGALQNVWNAVVQGFARVYTYLQAIVASISTTLDPNILQEPINDLKTFITGKVPELPDLDTSGFGDREWSWMVTINHPINVSFEVLNSQTLESARPTIKGFTSGVLILLTTIYMYRRIPEIVKG